MTNPYSALIRSCNDSPTSLIATYSTHRTNRNAFQAERLLSPSFSSFTLDPILAGREPDRRHCLVFWARPSDEVRDLVGEVQTRLTSVAPRLWVPGREALHLTVLEMTHSKTEEEIEERVVKMRDGAKEVVRFPCENKTGLVKPMLCFDAQALALSFLPEEDGGRGYTYHHLRRDVYDLAVKTGVEVESRYVVPSAHVTLGRFVDEADFETEGKLDGGKVGCFVEEIERVNEWLKREFWEGRNAMRWVVGDDGPMELRRGTVWYGGGETVSLD